MIQVNPELCKDNEACMMVCPQGAIGYRDGHTYIDPHLCQECGACIRACPEGAISEVQTEPTMRTIAIRPAPIGAQAATPGAPSPGEMLPDLRSERDSIWRRPWLPVLGSALVWASREIVPQVIRIWRESASYTSRTPVSAQQTKRMTMRETTGRGGHGRGRGLGRSGRRRRSRQRGLT